MALMTYTTMGFHNMCVVHKVVEPNTDHTEYLDKFFADYPLPRCPMCTRRKVVHCIHNTRAVASSSKAVAKERRDELARQLYRQKLIDSGVNPDDDAN